MPDTTPDWEIPYPLIADPVQVHTDMQALASRVDFAVETAWNAVNNVGYMLTYDPGWFGPTALSMGSGGGAGTKVGRYVNIGRLLVGHIHIIRGSGTNTGSDVYSFEIPPVLNFLLVGGNGAVKIGDVLTPVGVVGIAAGRVGLTLPSGARLAYNNRPGGGAWATGDQIGFTFMGILA